jgi:hypothetical protein
MKLIVQLCSFFSYIHKVIHFVNKDVGNFASEVIRILF